MLRALTCRGALPLLVSVMVGALTELPTVTLPKFTGPAGRLAIGAAAAWPEPVRAALRLPPSVLTSRLPLTPDRPVGANSTVMVQSGPAGATVAGTTQVPPVTLKRDEPLMLMELMCRSALPSLPTVKVCASVLPTVTAPKAL